MACFVGHPRTKVSTASFRKSASGLSRNREVCGAPGGATSSHGLHLQSLILPMFASFLLTPSHAKLGLLSQEASAPAPTNFAGACLPVHKFLLLLNTSSAIFPGLYIG